MFYYLGRKKRLAKLYPEPKYPLIIEPFAGSAAYSLHGDRWMNNVWINDKNSRTMAMWHYLHKATQNQILNLPNPKQGEILTDYLISDVEVALIGCHTSPGANQNTNSVSRFSRWNPGKQYIATNLHKIKHWQFFEKDYTELPDVEATWFIDPPYQNVNKKYYLTSDIDYNVLAEWCHNRYGQIIVCEREDATWLPFRPIAEIAICGYARSKEMVWIRERSKL